MYGLEKEKFLGLELYDTGKLKERKIPLKLKGESSLDISLEIEMDEDSKVTITGILNSKTDCLEHKKQFKELYRDIYSDIRNAALRDPKITRRYSQKGFLIEFERPMANLMGSSIIKQYLNKIK